MKSVNDVGNGSYLLELINNLLDAFFPPLQMDLVTSLLLRIGGTYLHYVFFFYFIPSY